MIKKIKKICNNYFLVFFVAFFSILILSRGFAKSSYPKFANEVLAVTGALNLNTSGDTYTPGGIWKSNGSVGIGTTVPGSKLDVSGTVNTSSTITAAGAIAANGGISQDGNVLLNGTDTWFRSTGATGWYNTYGGGWYMTDASWIKSYNSKPIYVTGNGTNSAVFMSGNVGIGTTAPGAKLEVYNSAAGYNTIWNTAAGNYQYHAFKVGGVDKGYIQWNINDNGTAVGTAMHINNTQGKLHLYGGNTGTPLTIDSGNVGIGTTAPSVKLDVAGCSLRVFYGQTVGIGSDGSGSYFGSNEYMNGACNAWVNDIATNPSGMMYIDNAGGIQFYTRPASYGNAVGTAKMIILNDGKVGVGVSPTYQFQVSGSVYASGSSKRFKQNIKDLEVDSTKIYNLRPVSFDYRPEYKSYGKMLGGGRQIGLVAEEVFKTIPELSIKLEDQISNVDYEKLSVLLLSETQKQKKDIDSLTSKVKSLEQRLKLIESKLK